VLGKLYNPNHKWPVRRVGITNVIDMRLFDRREIDPDNPSRPGAIALTSLLKRARPCEMGLLIVSGSGKPVTCLNVHENSLQFWLLLR